MVYEDDAATYRFVYSGELKSLNYLTTANTDEFAIAANLVDGLIEYDSYGAIQPGLATDWTASEDNAIWTFHLRQDVQWRTHEGDVYAEVVADDFVAAMEYILDSNNESLTANIAYGVIDNAEKYYNGEITDFESVGIKALDEYTLEYTLKEPTPYFLSMLSYVCFFPANRDFLNEREDGFGTDHKNLLYNGAYILETFQPQARRVLTANEEYWDKENVFIKKIIATYNKEALTLAPELFIRGEIDSAAVPSVIVDEWMKDAEKATQLRPVRSGYYSYFYAFNFNPKFSAEYEPDHWRIAVNNRNFRKSIFHAFDRVAAMMTLEPYQPESNLLNTITPPNFIDLDGMDYTLLDPLKKFDKLNSFNKDLALEYKDRAMEELKDVLDFPIKVLMPYNSSSSSWGNRVQIIKQQMENLLGPDYIDIIIDSRPPTGFLSDTRRNGNYALLECNWGPDYADPQTYTVPFAPDGEYNWPNLAEGYKEANGKNIYENKINKATAEVVDIQRRYTLFAEAEAYFIEEAFVIPYAVSGGGYVASKLNPFESQYAPFGVAGERYKGQKLMDKAMNSDEYYEALERWQLERVQVLSEGK